MSVLINGMDMPTGNNAVSIIIFPNGKVSLASDYRFAKCAEAVHIPPHGRLGDLDELASQIINSLEAEGDRWLLSPERIAQRVMRVADLKRIINAPTIIPAEEGE